MRCSNIHRHRFGFFRYLQSMFDYSLTILFSVKHLKSHLCFFFNNIVSILIRSNPLTKIGPSKLFYKTVQKKTKLYSSNRQSKQTNPYLFCLEKSGPRYLLCSIFHSIKVNNLLKSVVMVYSPHAIGKIEENNKKKKKK